ncbi:similar to sphingosine kinase [Cyanidioschyzon merolae strain 10D]|jgi:diacylglycerol kinase family enzyme|uniref:Similar to sphingosine kinase n=1 Tax=Cyanidioschyzon merolae (strain NIES-3377 / 10D) TaxID=280699 RepID=M1VMC4_CYAM1|nr:similar to sphingosine kinase [Cyanidioschyzon merolae strain 10D]BAM83133.1 similar to sphingosine kinase [Cyanidioschyzon merolae strain 10D]|eukprot:XP_005539169.1 similar to sphingosine kinase [Cyanidioschyzon merolae strain 10D]
MVTKRLFVVINSRSGGKNFQAVKRRWEEVKRTLLAAEPSLEIEEFWTQFPDDLPTRAAVFAPSEPLAVLCVGGDGTFHQVANVLYGTEVPLGIIPLGTGNGLAASFGVVDALEAARRIGTLLHQCTSRGELCGVCERLDAFHYEITDVSAKSWAKETESYRERRCCGCLRFRRRPKAVSSENTPLLTRSNSGEEADEADSVSTESSRMTSRSSLNGRSNGYAFLSLTIGLVADLDIRTERMRCLGQIRFNIGAGWYILRKRVFSAAIEYRHVIRDSQSEMGWRTADELTETIAQREYVLIVIMNVTHASPQAQFAPLANAHDACMDVLLVPAGVSRLRLAQFMFQLESGQHIHDQSCRYFKCSWIRIKLDPPQLVSLDGEAYHRARSVVLEQGGDHVPVIVGV